MVGLEGHALDAGVGRARAGRHDDVAGVAVRDGLPEAERGPGRLRLILQAPVERALVSAPLDEVEQRARAGEGVRPALRPVERHGIDGLEANTARDAEPGEQGRRVLLRRPVLQALQLAVEPRPDVVGLLEDDGGEAHTGEVERSGQPGRAGPDDVDLACAHVGAPLFDPERRGIGRGGSMGGHRGQGVRSHGVASVW